jgi:L-ascorbate metabolism protein UlaG (beta-lactamase superfamily)
MGGARFLTDPTFDTAGEYHSGAIVLKKLKGPAVAAEAVGNVDAVLLSHDQHWDNFDRGGRAFLEKAKRAFTTPAGSARLMGNAVGLSTWETQSIEASSGHEVQITATPARHGPHGFESMSGEVCGFALGIEKPGDAIYVTGDTVWYDGVAEIARRFRPRLVIAFTGAAKPRGPFRVTMDSNDAIETAAAFPDSKIIGIHNDGWAHFTENQADLAQAFVALGIGSRLQKIEPGVRTSLAL